jgi:dephospho-CoA kinase
LFGRWILNSEGQIERSRLAKIVFDNPAALQALEGIIHPLVSRAVDLLIRRTPHQIVVVEAIKLLESGLAAKCNAVWVTYTPDSAQVARLVEKRGMTQAEALSRIRMQSSQKDKISKADLVVINDASFEKIWKQVYDAWNKIPANIAEVALETPVSPTAVEEGLESAFDVRRGSPRDAAEIALLMNQMQSTGKAVNRADVIESFGEKAYMLLYNQSSGDLLGLMTWQVENLITRVFDILLLPGVFAAEAVTRLLQQVEEESKVLQVEACMIFMPEQHGISENILEKLGYHRSSLADLDNGAWQEAAREGLDAGQVLYMKVLRTQRVLRPI